MAIEAVDYDKCADCGRCYLVCPMDVFGTFAGKIHIKYMNDCVACFQCHLVCRNEAIVFNLDRAQPIPPPRINV
jgi:NAD-dependent dihydropyrimidine dehydrogenase PreA subunit